MTKKIVQRWHYHKHNEKPRPLTNTKLEFIRTFTNLVSLIVSLTSLWIVTHQHHKVDIVRVPTSIIVQHQTVQHAVINKSK